MSDTNVDTAVDYWYVMQMESFFFFPYSERRTQKGRRDGKMFVFKDSGRRKCQGKMNGSYTQPKAKTHPDSIKYRKYVVKFTFLNGLEYCMLL